jgi:hypothetical protein
MPKATMCLFRWWKNPVSSYPRLDRKAEGSGGWFARTFRFEWQRVEMDEGQVLNRPL